ncbi:MAG TPA: GNAT family N-acetyltransferase [Cryomorphaceae bacterium]|nr:GNAT family N-acetyltransferase [Cryomorphaceae bacterium]
MAKTDSARIRILTFGELTAHDLHAILKIRVDVFVVEQNCAYPELDGLDPGCTHALAFDEEGAVVGTARIAPPGLIYAQWSIGRVAVAKSHRGKNFGKDLMVAAMDYCDRTCDTAQPIKIAAQTYLEKFYVGLGFEATGDPYLWDGILHVDMVRA